MRAITVSQVRSVPSPLQVVIVVLAGLLASCGGPDRSTAAEDLGDELRERPGVVDALVSYTPPSLELREAVTYIVTVDPEEGASVACAVVRAFVEGFADTGIDADEASLELRDTGTPPLPWAFSTRLPTDAATAEAECVTSQQVRAVPIAYSAAGAASSDDPTSRPTMRLRFRGGSGVATPEEGEALARTHMPAFDDFDWDVLIICGQRPC